MNRDEEGIFHSSYPCWIQCRYAEPVTCSNVEIILGGNNYQAHRLKVLASEDGLDVQNSEATGPCPGRDDRALISSLLMPKPPVTAVTSF